MTPTELLLQNSATAVTQNTGIGADSANVVLIKEPFDESRELEYADLTLADFTGSGPIAVESAGALYWDSSRQQYYVRLIPPAGGWSWQTASPGVNLPQTIYGFAITQTGLGGPYLLATHRLEEPRLLQEMGEEISIDDVEMPISKFMFTRDNPV